MLGVPRDADAKAIRDAFRTLALRYHPDRNKEPGAEERFKQIAEAYAVLSDPKKRAAYDAGGFIPGIPPEDLFAGINFDEIFRDLGFGFGGSFFDRVFRRRPEGPMRGENLEVSIEVPLEKIAQGGEEAVHVTRPVTCTACRGSGALAGTAPRSCSACNGTGQHVTRGREANVIVQRITVCSACRGRGSVIDKPCTECGGSGSVLRDQVIEVKIPIGVEEGMVLRVPGRGLPSEQAGGAAGDLFVAVYSAPDPRFERNRADLWHNVAVPVADAVLGTSLEVPMLEGRATVKIPPGTQAGTVFRLAGKGLPRFDGGHGALLIRLQVLIPEHVSAEERKLYERLQALSRK